MKFTNLTRQLHTSSHDALTLEDILGMITMLCDDVRFETGMLVEKCPVNNWEQMIDRLYAVSYTINYIYQKHRKSIASFDPASIEDAIWSDLSAIQAQTAEANTKLKQLDAIKSQKTAAEKKLREELKEQQEKQKEISDCHSRISKLQQELEQLKSSSLPQLRKNCNDLEKEAEICRTEYKTLTEKAGQLTAQTNAAKKVLVEKQGIVSNLESDLMQLKKDGSDADTMKQTIEQELTIYKNSITALVDKKQELEEIRAQNIRLQEDIEAVSADLSDAHAEYNSLSDSLNSKSAQLRELQNQCTEINTVIEAKLRQIAKKTQDHTEKTRELNALNEQLSSITEIFSNLLEEIEQRKKQLSETDPDATERELEEDKRILEERICKLKQAQNELEILAPKIAAVTQDLEKMTQEKEDQLSQLDLLQTKADQLRMELSILGEKAFQDRLHHSQVRLELIQQLHDRMVRSAKALDCGWSANLQEDLQIRVVAAEDTIQELQSAVAAYAQLWQTQLNGEIK